MNLAIYKAKKFLQKLMSKNLKPVLKALKLEKPKASCSAFVFFAKDMRKKLQDENPENTFKDVSTKLGEMWKSLPEEDREYYEELSKIDKSRFKEEKRIYRQVLYQKLSKALQDGTIQPSQIDKSILPVPKQPRPPFMFYARHVRPMLKMHCEGEKAQAALGKPLSVMWNSLNNQQRIPFNIMSQEDVQRAREDRLQEQEIKAMLGQ
ncbi:HMG box family protein [Tritrichomonas foetus]|uniref:HMG box family protein n=1 Tax=Tritrichomonas foetus TaxID=1144522 RepID=A0A1J4JVN6_9EUKA|nr:HMG box family protein [Tritrichomonas foetus]|eukprot:OHT01598.1 HMG box family protein [Tritrichomonas foetus]